MSAQLPATTLEQAPEYSLIDPAALTFFVIPAMLVCALLWGTGVAWRRSGAGASAVRRALVLAGVLAVGWMALSWSAAASGVLLQWQRTPPPFALLVVAIVVIAVTMTASRFGARIAREIPLWVLIGIQAFRLPLELAMHAMYTRGVMPVQMSYSGLNFDIVTGITAIVVAWLVATGRAGRNLVTAWNVLGLVLLLNVVVVAILATPRFRYFGDDHLNTWVMYPPFVWLPAVMVLAALAGHLLIFRAVESSRLP